MKLPEVVSEPSWVYETVALSSDSETVPLSGLLTVVTESVAPSGSESLASRVEELMLRVPPSATEAESLLVTGGSLTSFTVRVNVAEVESVPSLAVMRRVRVAGVSDSRGVPLRV